jgi:hypothetical protein
VVLAGSPIAVAGGGGVWVFKAQPTGGAARKVTARTP